VRAKNEDSVLADDARRLWAVADGLGGHENGEVASASVVAALKEIPPNPRALEGEVRAAILGAHRDLYAQNVAGSLKPGMGTTVAALGAASDSYFCLWAGDSRICRVRGTELSRLTRDHRYLQDLIEAGAITAAQAASHPQRNAITRAVGIDRGLSLDRVGGEIRAGDRFILMTDGVSDVCGDAEIAERLAIKSLENAADDLVALCLAKGAPDNVSFVIVQAS
jgi:serine/threonine protein phosphatase PrpC